MRLRVRFPYALPFKISRKIRVETHFQAASIRPCTKTRHARGGRRFRVAGIFGWRWVGRGGTTRPEATDCRTAIANDYHFGRESPRQRRDQQNNTRPRNKNKIKTIGSIAPSLAPPNIKA